MHKYILAFLFISPSIFAQNYWETEALVKDSLQQIKLNFGGYMESEALNNSFSNKFIYGGFINEELKLQSLNKKKEDNLLEAMAHGQLSYTSALKNKWFWGVNYQYNQMAYAQYNKDLFELIFMGNQHLPKADIQNTSFFNLAFHSLAFAFGRVHQKNQHHLQWELSPSLLIANQYNKSEFQNSTLLTSENGEAIQFTGFYNQSSGQNGTGAALNARVYYQNKNLALQLNAQNIGVIRSTLDYESFEGAFTFEGVEVDDIFALDEQQTDVNLLSDTLTDKSRGTANIVLPFQLYLGSAYALSDHYKLNASIRYLHQDNFLPQANFGFMNANKYIDWGLNISYGGATEMLSGIRLAKDFGNLKVHAVSNNFIGFITPSNTTAQGFSFAAAYLF